LLLDEYRSFNALAETINGLYKTEVIEHEGPWSGKKDVEMATLNWVHWYNKKRLFGPLGYISPATAERNFYNTDYAGKISADIITQTSPVNPVWFTISATSLTPTTTHAVSRP
jgi:hypothetical protein